ncbi:MAG: hypothetical protein CL610_28565 [Anaerolineaceae bacterium]|nr:hypothetical protein [Anaerolineaceae bacterium]
MMTMNRIDVTLNLPQELVEQARSAGLLTDDEVERWLIAELERQGRQNRFFNTLDQLSSLEPSITPEEIDAEIEAYRQEKRQRKQGKDQ